MLASSDCLCDYCDVPWALNRAATAVRRLMIEAVLPTTSTNTAITTRAGGRRHDRAVLSRWSRTEPVSGIATRLLPTEYIDGPRGCPVHDDPS